jgi:mono/diheme cytochrome c family protein
VIRACVAGAAIVLLVLALAGCAGDGSQIPEDMTGGGDDRIQPTLASIQAHVFTPICTECHVPGGPGPMPLTSEAVSYQSLVNAESIELPPMLRVSPGDSEASYIVHKIEGRSTILGERMPLPPRPMLTAEQIAAIVEWIDSGAAP